MSKIKHHIKLYPFQMEILMDKTQYRVVVAGRRVGKSFTAGSAVTAHLFAVKGRTALIVGKDHKSTVNTFWKPLLVGDVSMGVPPILDKGWVTKTLTNEREIHLINGGLIKLSGSENADSLRGMSPSPSIIVCDEFDSFSPDVFYEVLEPMMTDRPGAPFLLMGTPAVARGQLYEAYQRGQDPKFPEWKSWQHSALSVRPDMKVEIARAKRNNPPDSFDREYNANFGNIKDNVFRDFSINNRSGNVRLELEPFQPGETIHIALDFNVNIMAASAFAIRRGPLGDQMEFLREWQGAANTDELVKVILGEFEGEKICIYPDPSGNSRKSSAAIGKTDFSILRDAGFIVHAHKAAPGIVDSVNCTNAMIMNAEGKRRFFVAAKCKELINSMLSTRWVDKESAMDRPQIDKTQNKEHFSDGVRYACEYLFPIRGGKVYVKQSKHF